MLTKNYLKIIVNRVEDIKGVDGGVLRSFER